MKVFKRNAVIVAVMLFVCMAVYLNWSYNNEEDAVSGDKGIDIETDFSGGTSDIETDAENEEGGAGLYYTASEDEVSTQNAFAEYFDTVRLERQQARAEASVTLETIASSEGATEETINDALKKMTSIAEWTVKEVELENLINAKGFIDSVVYMSEDGITVTVAVEEGLSTAMVARITDVVTSETEYTADMLTVVEIK